VLRQPVRVWLSVVGAWALAGLVKVVGLFLLVVPGMVAIAVFAFLTPSVVVERLDPVAAMGRALSLARRRPLRVVGAVVLIAASSMLVTAAFGLAGLVAQTLVSEERGWFVRSVVDLTVSVVVTPAVAASASLLYVDLRCRTEGLDLAWEATRRFAPVGGS
jgi:hypothetical protein